MTDAFQCERCEEYNGGSGRHLRVGEFTGTSLVTSDSYSIEIKTELCEDCYTEVLDQVREYVEEDGDGDD
jgi:hypothetical protein